MSVTKSKIIPSKKTKTGSEYIVYDDLPQDQKDGFYKMDLIGCVTCMQLKEENNRFTPYYHDYQKWYSQWFGESNFIIKTPTKTRAQL